MLDLALEYLSELKKRVKSHAAGQLSIDYTLKEVHVCCLFQQMHGMHRTCEMCSQYASFRQKHAR